MTRDLDRLLACLERYQAACLDHEDATARVVDDRSDEAARAQVEAAEAVIMCRLELYGSLVESGWEPPPDVRALLIIDAAVVGLATGARGG